MLGKNHLHVFSLLIYYKNMLPLMRRSNKLRPGREIPVIPGSGFVQIWRKGVRLFAVSLGYWECGTN